MIGRKGTIISVLVTCVITICWFGYLLHMLGPEFMLAWPRVLFQLFCCAGIFVFVLWLVESYFIVRERSQRLGPTH